MAGDWAAHNQPWPDASGTREWYNADPWAVAASAASIALKSKPKAADTPTAESSGDAWGSWKPGSNSWSSNTATKTGWNSRSGQYATRVKVGPQGERLQVIDWKGLEIVPVRKDFAVEHPVTAARTEEACEAIRTRHSIQVIHSPVSDNKLPKPVTSFTEAPFPDWCALQLKHSGFQEPTAIQVQAWPSILKGYDFVGIAETGSGKTLAYLLPMLVHIMAQPELQPGEGPVGLVIVPTRELCNQVLKIIESFRSCTGIVAGALYGGENIDEQARVLANRMDVAVACPGRLVAILNARVTNLRRATFIVLDEADELLGQGFGEQIRLILSQVRPDRQALLFSATWPSSVEELAADVCTQQPIHINVGSTNLSACRDITQRFHFLKPGETKFDILCVALDRIRPLLQQGHRALVFCNHKTSVSYLVPELVHQGYRVEGFNSAESQVNRDDVLRRFTQTNCDFDVLVCTQVLGRGHDFRHVRFVVNFDMPYKIVEYVHRIGRTGRAGTQGASFLLMLEGDMALSRQLRNVLLESEQEVPDEIARAAKQIWRFQNMSRSVPYRGKYAESGGGNGGYDAGYGGNSRLASGEKATVYESASHAAAATWY